MKQDFRTLWKTRHNNKQNTARDTLQYCILRAMAAKGEDKVSIALHFVRRAFTPISNPNKLNNGAVPFQVLTPWITSARIGKIFGGTGYSNLLGVPADQILDEEEIEQFNKIAASITPSKALRRYSYFFTRQDIFPEYQLVQTAHAALELGVLIGPDAAKDLYFTCCGVKDLKELEEVEELLTNLGYTFVTFREPDIGNQKTAIAVYPIWENQRGQLRNFNLLRFNVEQVDKEVR
jgi:hypothetical protein